jgi:hypothetical protein
MVSLHAILHGFPSKSLGLILILQVSRIIDGDVDDSFDPKVEMAASDHLASQM